MTITTLYRQFRQHSPFMLVGRNAELALSAARTFGKWEEMEADGLVKIEAHIDHNPDPSFYDTWEHLSDKTREQLKQAYCDDCWGVITYYRCPHCGDWQQADSVWGCSGYSNPCDAFENCYVIDLMQSAIEQVAP